MNITFPLILDGAMGTQLQKAGLPKGACPEEWILDNPQAAEKIQKAYVKAGSQVIYAPTFGANTVMLENHRLLNKVDEYNKKLVGISKKAADGKALVAGDISSIGGMLYPMGNMSFEDMFGIYLDQAKALEEAGVDLFVIETMTTIPEARAALLAVKSVSIKPVFVTFSCDENGRTMMGTDVCAALEIMQGMGADAFGLNCSVGPGQMLKQFEDLYELSNIPLIAKPNAGLPKEENGRLVYSAGPAEFAVYVPQLAEAGVSIFGSCCGSNEDHIAAIKEALENVKTKDPDPRYTDLLPCATEKNVFLLDPAEAVSRVFACDGDLEENLCDLDPEELFGIEINTMEDAALFADVQYAIKNPLCIICSDAEILEYALRSYQGRALYDGELSDEILIPLAEKYGLII